MSVIIIQIIFDVTQIDDVINFNINHILDSIRFANGYEILEKKIDIDFRQSPKCRYSREKYYFCGNPFSSLPVLRDTSGCHEE